jgi:peroxiredoxin
MAQTESAMLPIGTAAPTFSLKDVTSNKTYSLSDFADNKGLLVMVISNHCPFVVHVRQELARIGRDYRKKDVAIVAVSANDADRYPDDAPDKLAAMAASQGFTFPFLYDESQTLVKALNAACTPDFFLFDGSRRLVYRGRLDESRPGNASPVTGRDLRRAVDRLLSGEAPVEEQHPSIGCSIKWKP